VRKKQSGGRGERTEEILVHHDEDEREGVQHNPFSRSGGPRRLSESRGGEGKYGTVNRKTKHQDAKHVFRIRESQRCSARWDKTHDLLGKGAGEEKKGLP